jgi:SPP1 gp7 family putative phage head morphogenesis protein
LADPVVDASVRHQIFVERLAATNANTLDPELKQLAAFVRSRVADEGGRISSKKAMTKLKSDIQKRFFATYKKWEDETNTFLSDLSDYETKFQTGIVEAETVDDYTAKKPANKDSRSAFKNQPLMIGANGGAVAQSSLVGNFARSETDKVTALVETGYYQGRTTAEIIGSIVGTKANRYKDGVMTATKRNATSVSKTSAEHVSVMAADTVYQENGDAVRGYIWTSVLDSKTSQICRSRDGEKYAFTDSFQPKPPAHVNCRSTTRPWLREDLERIKKAERQTKGAGEPEYESTKKQYYTWLKEQPAWFQDQVLGPTQGRIFRNSGLTPQEFKAATVKMDGTPLTIAEMAEKDDRIMDYLAKSE